MMQLQENLSDEALTAFEPDMKVGLLATLNQAGDPHLSLITTLCGHGQQGLVWGQFCEGASKDNVRRDPRAGACGSDHPDPRSPSPRPGPGGRIRAARREPLR